MASAQTGSGERYGWSPAFRPEPKSPLQTDVRHDQSEKDERCTSFPLNSGSQGHMQKNATFFLLTAVIIANTPSVHAAQIGSVEEGLVIARQRCAECHLVVKERGRSTRDNAPTFAAIANTPGMSATALRATFNTSHRAMPNLVIEESEADSIIAYILSLRDN